MSQNTADGSDAVVPAPSDSHSIMQPHVSTVTATWTTSTVGGVRIITTTRMFDEKLRDIPFSRSSRSDVDSSGTSRTDRDSSRSSRTATDVSRSGRISDNSSSSGRTGNDTSRGSRDARDSSRSGKTRDNSSRSSRTGEGTSRSSSDARDSSRRGRTGDDSSRRSDERLKRIQRGIRAIRDPRATGMIWEQSAANSCTFAHDGQCDEPHLCKTGTDSADCHAREIEELKRKLPSTTPLTHLSNAHEAEEQKRQLASTTVLANSYSAQLRQAETTFMTSRLSVTDMRQTVPPSQPVQQEISRGFVQATETSGLSTETMTRLVLVGCGAALFVIIATVVVIIIAVNKWRNRQRRWEKVSHNFGGGDDGNGDDSHNSDDFDDDDSDSDEVKKKEGNDDDGHNSDDFHDDNNGSDEVLIS